MDTELDLFRNIILALFHTHERPYAYSNHRAKETFVAMQAYQLAPIQRIEQLQAALPTTAEVDRSFPNRDFLYLNPITNDAITVPILWMTSDFSRSLPKISVLLGLFTLDNGDLKGLGYRFEAPEGQSPEGRGIHNYYHVQIIRKLRGVWFPPDKYSRWMPESQPAFPIDCANSIHLMIALLVALYGRDEALRPLLQKRDLAKGLQLRRESMKYHAFSDVTWHWMIRNSKTGEEHKYYQSAQEVDSYEEVVRRYPGCLPVKVLPSKYDSSPSGKKEKLDV